MVRIKCVVNWKNEHPDGSSELYLSPVVNGSEENKSFFKLTPGGIIQFQCLNSNAVQEFEIGKEYYVDFSKV